MKPEELMLGDIVLASGKPIHVTLATLSCKVDVNPLILNQEILLDSGFERDRWYPDEVHINDYWYWRAGKLLCRVSKDDDYVEVTIPCRFVHDLQHWLKLCGIEKEVVV